MKFTNVKQLIIKFMGGGIINFPTRFLRWVKINGDSEDDGSDDGGGGDSGSMSMYDAWMKAFNGFKLWQDNNGNNILNVAPALYMISAYDYNDETIDTPIPLTFMNSETRRVKTFIGDSLEKVFNIKDAPDDVYIQALNEYTNSSFIEFLYDLEELNEKASNIQYAYESLKIDNSHNAAYDSNEIFLTRGKASYVPAIGVYKFNDKYYVWFPASMD